MERVYRITTPEQATIEYALAGIGSRAIAVLLDYAIMVATTVLLGLGLFALARQMPGGFTTAVSHTTPIAYMIALYILVAFLLWQFYFVLFELLWDGKTPGKRLLQLRVVSLSGRSISFFSSFIRNLLRLVDFLPSGYLVGMVFVFFTKNEQRLGDLAGGTLVVFDRRFHERDTPEKKRKRKRRRKRDEEAQANLDAPVPEAVRTLAALVRRTDERELTRAFLRRQDAFAKARRDELGRQIVEKLLSQPQATEGALSASIDWARTQPPATLLSQFNRAWEEEDASTDQDRR